MSDDASVTVAINGEYNAGPAVSAAVAGVDSLAQEIQKAAALIAGETAKVGKSIDQMGAKIESGFKSNAEHSKKLHDEVKGLGAMFEEAGSKFEHAFSGSAILGELAGGVLAVVGPMAILELAVEGVHKAFEVLVDLGKEGIVKGDEIRDLSLSLGVFTGSSEKGAEALEFFEKRMDQTRNTAHELAAEFIRLEPLAKAKGFGQGATQDITVMLSQLATVAGNGETLSSMAGAFQNMLAGRVRPGNPLLKVLGITKTDVDGLGWDQLVDKMEEVSSRFPEFGQSFDSEMRKIKESIVIHVAEGFNEWRDTAKSGMAGLKEALADPSFIEALRTIGKLTASAVAGITELIEKAEYLLVEDDHPSRFLQFLSHMGGPGDPGQQLAAAAAMTNADVVVDYGAWKAKRDQKKADEEYGNAVSQLGPVISPRFSLRDFGPGWQGFSGAGDFYRQAGHEMAGMDDEQISKFIGKISAAAKDGIITLKEYKQAVKLAFAPDPAEIPPGTIKDDSAKLLAELNQKLEDQIHVIDATAQLAGQQRASLTRLAQVVAGDPSASHLLGADAVAYRRSNISAEAQHLNALAEYQKRADTDQSVIDALGGQKDDRSKRRVEAAQKELEAVQKLIASEGELYAQERAQAEQNFLGKRFEDGTKALDSLGETFRAQLEDLRRETVDWDPQIAAKVKAEILAVQHELRDNMRQAIADWQRGIVGITWLPGGGFRLDNSFSPQAMQDATKQEGTEEKRILETGKRLNDEAERSAKRIAQTFETAFGGIESELGDIFRNGGRDFGKIAADTMSTLGGDALNRGLESLVQHFAGVQFNDATGLYSTTDVNGKTITSKNPQELVGRTGFGRNLAIAGAAIDAGVSGYEAGYSGTPGARTGSALSGAATGAALGFQVGGAYGAVIGAVAGLVVSAIGAAIGAQERQDNYKYGNVSIRNGVASFSGNQEYTGDESGRRQARDIAAQIQAKYDQTHDELVNLLLKFPSQVAIPDFNDLTGRGQSGQEGGGGTYSWTIQSRASANFEKHLQEWINNELPREMLGDVEAGMAGGFEKLGFAADRFHEIFTKFSNLDPSKAIQLFSALAESMTSIQKTSDFFHGQDPTLDLGVGGTKNTGSATYWNEMVTLGNEHFKRPGDIIAETDAEIFKLTDHLKDFSAEGQVAQLQQIAQLQQQRYDAEKAAIRDIFNFVENAKQSIAGLNETLDVQGLTKADGTPDQYAIAQYYKTKTDQDLKDLQGANSTAEAQAALQRYQKDVMAAEQAGLTQADAAQRAEWIKWARDANATAMQLVNDDAIKFGKSIDDVNDTYNLVVDPALEAFTQHVTDAGDAFSTIGDPGGPIDDVRQRLKDAGGELVSFSTTLLSTSGSLGDAFNRLVSQVDLLSAKLAAVTPGGGDGGNGGGGNSVSYASAALANRLASQAA